ncbi:MAG: response regulator [Fuerstiella sp.]
MHFQQTVFIVDDDSAMRESMALLLTPLEVPVESFSSGEEFLESIQQHRPGCLVLDIRMAGMSGLELQRKLAECGEFLSIVIVSGHANVPLSVEAMRLGAENVLEKPFEPEIFRLAVQGALRSAESKWGEHLNQVSLQKKLSLLSPREVETLACLREGKTVKQLAQVLGISASTAEKHRLQVFRKFDVESVPELMLLLGTQ